MREGAASLRGERRLREGSGVCERGTASVGGAEPVRGGGVCERRSGVCGRRSGACGRGAASVGGEASVRGERCL